MLDDNWQNRVLEFWFEELTPKDWYGSTPELDKSITEQFEPLLKSLAQTDPESFEQDSRKLLAAIIVLDQFSRNIYRGTANAFDADLHAQKLTEYAVKNKLSAGMSDTEKHFCYMPLMHAEDLEKQDQSVALFEQGGNSNAIKHALEHRDIIKQFGRFPHRNGALNRESTAAEKEYLKTASTYGQ